eukprot:6490845-Amphidinium_carterae.2
MSTLLIFSLFARRRLDASSAALVHCSTGDPLSPQSQTAGSGFFSAGPAHMPQAVNNLAQPPLKRIRVPFRLPHKNSPGFATASCDT